MHSTLPPGSQVLPQSRKQPFLLFDAHASVDGLKHHAGGGWGIGDCRFKIQEKSKLGDRSPGSEGSGLGGGDWALERARAPYGWGSRIVLDFPTWNYETMINAVFRRWTARKGWRESGPERGLFICGRALR